MGQRWQIKKASSISDNHVCCRRVGRQHAVSYHASRALSGFSIASARSVGGTVYGLQHRVFMLAVLARRWRGLMVRAVLALTYGGLLFVWPRMRLVTFVWLFGLYTLLDGAITLTIGMDVFALTVSSGVLVESIVRLAAGLLALSAPAVLTAFPRFVAIWALLTGAAEAGVAYGLRSELIGEWPLPFAGAVSGVVALFLLLMPEPIGVPALTWLVGPYTLMLGSSLMALARRLHQIATEMRPS